MKKTLQKINNLVNLGIIDKYAIAGGMAQFYYIEPSVTYDLDLIINIPGEESTLNPLSTIYEWARSNKYQLLKEHIIIEGIPVQFLLAYNDLVKEALDNIIEITLFDEITYILSPEYLMAIMLQTGRSTDKERLIKFLNEAEYNEKILSIILKKFDLQDSFKKLKARFDE